MKKKIIKSYFFKNNMHPLASTMFSFSKRAVRIRKKSHRTTDLYRHYIITFTVYNQWSNSKISLLKLFNSSWYTNLKSVKIGTPNKKRILHYWYLLNRIYNTKLFDQFSSYPRTGLLSSHFVHFLSKKNITYQSRSKYRAELFNLSTLHSYIYLYTAFLYKHVQVMDQKKYFFTTNHSKQSETVDSDFNKNIFNWYSSVSKETPSIKHSHVYRNYVLNNSNYSWDDVKELMSKRSLITALHTDIDSANKDLIIQQLQLSSDFLLDITQTSLLFLNKCGQTPLDKAHHECLTTLHKLYILD